MIFTTRKKITRNKKNAGFSLIEILIVTVITTVVFTVIYGFYSATIKQNVESRYEIIASNLAQEGIEIIRNVRDENVLAEEDINDNLENGDCYPKIDSDGETSCSEGSFSIRINDDGWYVNSDDSSYQETPFERKCEIDGDTSKITATCTVSWKSFVNSSLERKSKAKVVLTAWKW